MKNLGRFAVLGAVLAASVPFASATPITGQISLQGTDTYTANTISFAPGTTSIGGAVLGTLATYFTYGWPVTMTNFATDGSFVPTTVFSVTENSETLTYFLQTLSTTFSNGGAPSSTYPGDLTLLGNGYFTLTGLVNYTNSPANFNLTSQYGELGGTSVTFSETSFTPAPAVTPELSSIALLGTGLLGVAALMRRKLMT